MKQSGLLLVAALSFLMSGLTMSREGWFENHHHPHLAPSSHPPHTVDERDALLSDAGFRWRLGQATHWRACLLQR